MQPLLLAYSCVILLRCLFIFGLVKMNSQSFAFKVGIAKKATSFDFSYYHYVGQGPLQSPDLIVRYSVDSITIDVDTNTTNVDTNSTLCKITTNFGTS